MMIGEFEVDGDDYDDDDDSYDGGCIEGNGDDYDGDIDDDEDLMLQPAKAQALQHQFLSF